MDEGQIVEQLSNISDIDASLRAREQRRYQTELSRVDKRHQKRLDEIDEHVRGRVIEIRSEANMEQIEQPVEEVQTNLRQIRDVAYDIDRIVSHELSKCACGRVGCVEITHDGIKHRKKSGPDRLHVWEYAAPFFRSDIEAILSNGDESDTKQCHKLLETCEPIVGPVFERDRKVTCDGSEYDSMVVKIAPHKATVTFTGDNSQHQIHPIDTCDPDGVRLLVEHRDTIRNAVATINTNTEEVVKQVSEIGNEVNKIVDDDDAVYCL